MILPGISDFNLVIISKSQVLEKQIENTLLNKGCVFKDYMFNTLGNKNFAIKVKVSERRQNTLETQLIHLKEFISQKYLNQKLL